MSSIRIKCAVISFLLLATVHGTTAGGPVSVADDFASGDTPLFLVGYTTNNEISLPDVRKVNGRYRAHVKTNEGDITLHYKRRQGRLDAKLVTFPFEYIARNIGIGSKDNSQIPPPVPGSGRPYIFAGIQVHVPDLDSFNSSHIVVGHRGNTRFTVEGKNTVNGVSWVSDAGRNVAPDGRVDFRIVGNMDRTLTVYWQTPNLTGSSNNDKWIFYRGNGKLPTARNQSQPVYGDSVYIGLITYAQGTVGTEDRLGWGFVGTCDAIEFIPDF